LVPTSLVKRCRSNASLESVSLSSNAVDHTDVLYFVSFLRATKISLRQSSYDDDDDDDDDYNFRPLRPPEGY